MTTEEKQLEKAVKSRLLDRGFNPDKLINNRGLIGAVIEEVLFFEQSNSQPPNLICGGGGQVIDSDYVESLIFEITQLTKENQELKTSLQQEKSRWVRTKGILIDTELKLKAVTKENQELKVYPKLLEDYKRGKNLEINDIKQQLQAAEDRIKELENGV